MAKFCSNCGSELQEGQACSCQEAAPTTETTVNQAQTQDIPVQSEAAPGPAQQQVAPNKPSNFGKYFNDALTIFKEFFKAPVDTVKKATDNEDWKPSIFILAANILIIAITSATISSRFYIPGLGSLDEIFGLLSSSSGSRFGFWIGRFFGSILFSAILYALLAASIYLGVKLVLKKDFSILKIGTTLAVATITLTLIAPVAFIFTFIKVSFASSLLKAGEIILLILFYIGMDESFGTDRNKSFYVMSAGVLVFVLFNYIFNLIL